MSIYVVSSGTTSGITVGSGSVMSVLDTGIATDITVTSGGVISAYAGGVTSGAILSFSGGSGGRPEENVLSGGISYYTSVHDAFEFVVAGKASGTTLTHSGQLEVSSGGMAVDTKIDGKSVATTSNGIFSATKVGNHASLDLIDAGKDYNTVVRAYGTETVEDGAKAFNTNVILGTEWLLSGTASGTMLHSGSYQIIYAGSEALDTRVFMGGMEQVMSGTSIDTVISSGGTETLFGGTESGTEIDGGTLQLDGGKVTGDINFTGTGGVLETSPAPNNEITGFTAGDTIFIVGVVPYSAGDSVSVTKQGNVEVSANGTTYDFKIQGAVVGETDFAVSAPPPGQFGIYLTRSASPAMTFLHPPASPSAGLTSGAAASAISLIAPDFASRIAGGGREAERANLYPSSLHSQETPKPAPFAFSATHEF